MPKIVDHQQRREEICAVTAKLIAKGGMDMATIREIAKASGYSKGVVEHYFENKAELISGALTWVNTGYENRVATAVQNLEGLAALRARFSETIPTEPSIHDEWRIRLAFWSLAASSEILQQQQGARFDRAIAQFTQDIQQAMEQGELNAPKAQSGELQYERCESLARYLLNTVTGMCIAALQQPQQYHKAFLLDEIDALVYQRLPTMMEHSQ